MHNSSLLLPLRRAVLALALAAASGLSFAAGPTLLNVSYDVARELYKDYNAAFVRHWKKTANEELDHRLHGAQGQPEGREGLARPRQARPDRRRAQEIAVKHSLRPRREKVMAKAAAQFPKVATFTVDEVFGGWRKAQAEHFNDDGIYDQILAARR